MGVPDVAGVFSRLFVVGFFLPAFFTGVALDQLTAGRVLPWAYRHQPGTRFLIMGGVAVLVGLALSALHGSALKVFGRALLASLRRLSPTRGENPVEPNRFGKALLAGRDEVTSRWGLDPVVVWPRVQALLKPEQQQLEADARADLAFLVNGTLGAAVVALAALGNLISGAAWHADKEVAIASAILSGLSYRLAANAATNWIVDVQGSLIDVSRRELYDHLGIPQPKSHAAELETARKLNAFLGPDPGKGGLAPAYDLFGPEHDG